MRAIDPDFRRQLEGYSLATAEIFYRMPDATHLLQTYVWQDYDLAPGFPILQRFLDFWERNLDGRLHSVRVTSCKLIGPSNARHCEAVYTLQ